MARLEVKIGLQKDMCYDEIVTLRQWHRLLGYDSGMLGVQSECESPCAAC